MKQYLCADGSRRNGVADEADGTTEGNVCGAVRRGGAHGGHPAGRGAGDTHRGDRRLCRGYIGGAGGGGPALGASQTGGQLAALYCHPVCAGYTQGAGD